MTDLDRALAAAREVARARDADCYSRSYLQQVVINLLAALDAARGEAVATVRTVTSLVGETRKVIMGEAKVIDALPLGTAVYAAPPADDSLADTQRAIIEAAERRGYERGLKDATPAAAVPAWAKHVKQGVALINSAKDRPFTVSEKAELLMLASMMRAEAEVPAVPDCGCCKGDGSMCPTVCRHAEENPPIFDRLPENEAEAEAMGLSIKENNRG